MFVLGIPEDWKEVIKQFMDIKGFMLKLMKITKRLRDNDIPNDVLQRLRTVYFNSKGWTQ